MFTRHPLIYEASEMVQMRISMVQKCSKYSEKRLKINLPLQWYSQRCR